MATTSLWAISYELQCPVSQHEPYAKLWQCCDVSLHSYLISARHMYHKERLHWSLLVMPLILKKELRQPVHLAGWCKKRIIHILRFEIGRHPLQSRGRKSSYPITDYLGWTQKIQVLHFRGVGTRWAEHSTWSLDVYFLNLDICSGLTGECVIICCSNFIFVNHGCLDSVIWIHEHWQLRTTVYQ